MWPRPGRVGERSGETILPHSPESPGDWEGAPWPGFQAASSWITSLVPGRAGVGHGGARGFLTGQAGSPKLSRSVPLSVENSCPRRGDWGGSQLNST